MAFVVALREYLRFTGDRAFVRSMMPTVFAQLAYDAAARSARTASTG